MKKFLDTVTMNVFSENVKRAGYDQAMHLFMLVKLESVTLKVEKNEVISITSSSWDNDAETIHPLVPAGRTFAEFMKKGQDSVSPEAFFIYDSRNLHGGNCQHFVSTLLKANVLMTPPMSSWINQSADKIYKHLGLGQVNKGITDANHILEGRGHDGLRIGLQ